MAKFGTLKVGDVCKVVGNCNSHEFEIGEKIRLDSVFDVVFQFGRGVGFSAQRLNGTSVYKNVVREIDLEKVENMAKFNVGDRVKNKNNDFGEIFFIAKDGEQKPIAVHFECEFRGHNCASCKESKKIAKEKYKEDNNCWWYDEEDLEKVENMDKMKEFTKSDLKEFDEVVYRDGDKSIFYQGDFRGIRTRYLEYYEENLLRKVLRNDGNNGADIMQVIRNNEVIWERIEKSPLQIELESLEQQQREIADKIAELSKKCN